MYAEKALFSLKSENIKQAHIYTIFTRSIRVLPTSYKLVSRKGLSVYLKIELSKVTLEELFKVLNRERKRFF